jgi:hypothetical protein
MVSTETKPKWMFQFPFWVVAFSKVLLLSVAIVVTARFCQLATRFLTAQPDEQTVAHFEEPRFIRLEKTIPQVTAGDPDRFEAEFALTNPTSEAMTVRSIRSSCACGDSEIDRQRIEPGETAVLKVSVRTTGRSGTLNVSCNVDMEPDFYWECQLKLKIVPLEFQKQSDVAR